MHKHFVSVLVNLGCYNRNTIDLEAYKKNKFISHRSNIKVLVDSISGKILFSGSYIVVYWLRPDMAERMRELSGVRFVRLHSHDLSLPKGPAFKYQGG